jgi:ribonuclease HI
MLITMFTDISLFPATGLGAYAIWAKESGEAIRHSDMFKKPIHDNNVAETCGIINGLAFVLNRLKPPVGSRIIVKTDSETAINVLHGANRHPMFAGLVETRNALLAGKGITVLYLHVKGHKGTVTPRHAVNTWCDREARKVLLQHQTTLI